MPLTKEVATVSKAPVIALVWSVNTATVFIKLHTYPFIIFLKNLIKTLKIQQLNTISIKEEKEQLTPNVKASILKNIL